MEKNKSTVFDLDVENIPDDWGIVSLKAIDLGGKENIDPRAYPGDDFEYYSIPAYQEGGKPVIEKGKNILSQKIIVQNDSVLFGKLNPRVEKVWHVQSETGYKKIASTEFIPIYPDQEKIFPRYLYYVEWSKFVMPKAKTLVTGSTPSRQRVDPTSFFKIKIPLPSRTEQVRIAFILSKLQQAIAQQEQSIMKTKELKRSLMHRLFTCGLRGDELKETEIGLMPESWSVKRLKDVVEKTSQKDMTKTPDIQFKYIDVSSISNESLKIIGSTTYKGSEAPSRARKIVKVNDVLFATVRPTLKRIAYVSSEFDGEICSTAFCVLRNNMELSSKYLYYCVQRDSFIQKLGKLQRGANYPAVTDGNVKDQLIPFPTIDEQEEIANTLWGIDNKIEHEIRSKSMLNELFKSMLNNLMTGQVRVKDIDFGEINV